MGPALNWSVARDSQHLSCHESHPQIKVIGPQLDQGIEMKGGGSPDGSMDIGNKKCAWPLYTVGWVWQKENTGSGGLHNSPKVITRNRQNRDLNRIYLFNSLHLMLHLFRGNLFDL